MVPQKPIGLANSLSNQDFLVFFQSRVLSFEHTAIKWLIPELQAVPAFQWSPSYGALTSDFFNDFLEMMDFTEKDRLLIAQLISPRSNTNKSITILTQHFLVNNNAFCSLK